MNRRDKFWLNNLFVFGGIILLLIGIALFNVRQFNKSYMEEEVQELSVFEKQIEWAITPYLQTKDYKNIQKYCDEFKNADLKIEIFDQNKNVIATSAKELPKTKKIQCSKQIVVNGQMYSFKLIVSEENVMNTIIRAQANLIGFIVVFFIFLVAGLVYIVHRLRMPFNRLQSSVIKISNGDLNADIEVSSDAILEELSIALKKMTTKLKTQIKRLSELEQYKSDFIQNVSHEIKTPITAINSAVELIENNDKPKDAQDRECFNIIQYQVRFINTLVNDILSLSEIEDEKNSEVKNFKEFNLNDAVRNVVNYTSMDFENINFVENVQISLAGDEVLISRAVTNLLMNAIKYSKSEKIDIILSKVDNMAEIQVKDYGVGIEEKHRDLVFERFYRIDKARSRKTGGTGLGLAIVKNIVELHNGAITLESEVAKGCDFILKLPITH